MKSFETVLDAIEAERVEAYARAMEAKLKDKTH